MTLEDLKKLMEPTRNAPPVEITVPVWGKMFVRSQTVAEADMAADLAPLPDGSKRRLALSAAQVICNESGGRLFDQTDPAHLDYLSELPWALLHKVVEAARNIYSDGDSAGKK